MNVKKNIGTVNALVRITIGLTVLAWSTAKYSKMPWRDSYLVMAVLGAMKVAEGIVSFCPVVALFENTKGNMFTNEENEKQLTDEFLPYNPS